MLVYLKTLSPVHIGSGETWDSLSPFMTLDNEKNKVIKRCYFVNTSKILRSLNSEEALLFSKWMDNITSAFERESKNNKKISNIRKEWSIENFLLKYKKLTNVQCKDLLTNRENYYYSAVVYSKSESPRNIVRHTITPDYRLYIPGSSIKGAIRTALAIKILQSMGGNDRAQLFQRISNVIRISKNKREVSRSIDQAESLLQKALFCYGDEGKWQHYDFCKFISIADCFTSDRNVGLYQVSVLTKIKRNKEYELRDQEINIFETIPSNTNMKFLLNIDFDKMKLEYTARSQSNRENEQKNYKKHNKFDLIFRLVFDVDFMEVMSKSKEERNEFIFNKIIEIIDYHSKNIIDEDKKWFRQFSNIPGIIDELDNISKSKGLLRIGYASGFLADTIFTFARKGDTSCKNLYKKIFEATALDLPLNMKKNNIGKERYISDAMFNSFPNSRRVVVDQINNKILPLGWVSIFRK